MLKETKRNGALTRQELRAAVYDCRPGLTRAEAETLLDQTLEEICAALIRGESVSLRSFGTFNVLAKRERIGRNPKNGVAATICARKVISFLPSPILVALVNGEARLESHD
jgi:integration host factor subunit alpha